MSESRRSRRESKGGTAAQAFTERLEQPHQPDHLEHPRRHSHRRDEQFAGAHLATASAA
jgi:hypothetical protein